MILIIFKMCYKYDVSLIFVLILVTSYTGSVLFADKSFLATTSSFPISGFSGSSWLTSSSGRSSNTAFFYVHNTINSEIQKCTQYFLSLACLYSGFMTYLNTCRLVDILCLVGRNLWLSHPLFFHIPCKYLWGKIFEKF